jgi:hypothetical protein
MLTETERQELNLAAERGAKWMDEKMPGWHNWIDLERLNVRSECDCILGQSGGFERLAMQWFLRSPIDISSHGFTAPNGANVLFATNDSIGYEHQISAEYLILNSAWRREIESRLLSDVSYEVEEAVGV